MSVENSPLLGPKITNELIEPNYFNGIKNGLLAIKIFSTSATILEVMAQLLHTASIITGSLAIPLENQDFVIISLALNIGSMAAKNLISCSLKESKENTANVNLICTKIGIDSIPDFTINQNDDSENSISTPKNNTKTSVISSVQPISQPIQPTSQSTQNIQVTPLQSIVIS
jgi:hypothetical protein